MSRGERAGAEDDTRPNRQNDMERAEQDKRAEKPLSTRTDWWKNSDLGQRRARRTARWNARYYGKIKDFTVFVGFTERCGRKSLNARDKQRLKQGVPTHRNTGEVPLSPTLTVCISPPPSRQCRQCRALSG